MPTSQLPKLVQTLVKILNDDHAIDTVIIDVQSQTTVTSYMVICSGRSSRQVKAIAEHAIELMKAQGFRPYSETGLQQADWVLIDFGEAVLHVMQPDARAFYHLEGLWQAQASE